MQKVVILIFSIFIFVQASTTPEPEDDEEICLKHYLETSTYDQSESCKELFDGLLLMYNKGWEIVTRRENEENQTCIREVLKEHHFDKTFFRGVSRVRVNGSGAFHTLNDFNTLKVTILDKYCNPENLLQEFYEKFVVGKDSQEAIHESYCVLKYLADEWKIFKIELIQSNSEIMSVKNCNMVGIINFFSNPPNMSPKQFFGVDMSKSEECIQISMRKYKPMENLIAYNTIRARVELTPELQTEFEKFKIEVIKSVKSWYNETINCYTNII